MIKERHVPGFNGWLVLAVLLGILFVSGKQLLENPQSSPIVWIIAIVLSSIALAGFFPVNPNEGKVLQFLGSYIGTVRDAGFRWTIPFFTRRSVSLRIRNFESQKLKVNDLDGNPIEIAAIVVWRVVDTAEALFQVDDFENYIKVQSESAIRNLATQYPYDAHEPQMISLHRSPAQIIEKLKSEIQDRLHRAGVEVIEARLSHLAYSPEIAATMLQRQQASAIIAARQKIVEGAVGMVELALNTLAKNKVVELDQERKASMVSNLLVVLCGERSTQPVINAGTIY